MTITTACEQNETESKYITHSEHKTQICSVSNRETTQQQYDELLLIEFSYIIISKWTSDGGRCKNFNRMKSFTLKHQLTRLNDNG